MAALLLHRRYFLYASRNFAEFHRLLALPGKCKKYFTFSSLLKSLISSVVWKGWLPCSLFLFMRRLCWYENYSLIMASCLSDINMLLDSFNFIGIYKTTISLNEITFTKCKNNIILFYIIFKKYKYIGWNVKINKIKYWQV